MRLNVSDIPDEGLQQEVNLPITVNDQAGPAIAYTFIKVFRIGKKVLVEGSVKISVSLRCGRCLRDFSLPLDLTFREEYNPAEEVIQEEEKELKETELDLSYYRNDEIDISELINEQVLLSVPMKPLCSSGCSGICPKCGKDLNEGACECKAEETDPRLAPLQKLKELMKDRKE